MLEYNFVGGRVLCGRFSSRSMYGFNMATHLYDLGGPVQSHFSTHVGIVLSHG